MLVTHNLKGIATDFYKKLAKKSMLHGTDDEEYFEVIRRDNEHTEVNMYKSNKSGEKKKRVFHRIYKTSETKEIFIYGLEGNDFFKITGSVRRGIKIHLVGGILQLGKEGKDKTSKVAENNIFEYLGNQFDENTFLPFPLVGFSSGDGFKLGFGFIHHRQEFNKAPLGELHKFSINYGFATGGLHQKYSGVFYEIKNHWDLVVNAEGKGKRYAFNYFGIGNESIEGNNKIDFYRVEQSKLYLDVGFQRRFAADVGQFSIRPLVQRTQIFEVENRFTEQIESNLTSQDFTSRWYAGGIADLNFSNADNPISP